MGILTIQPEKPKIEFDKFKVIEEIKEGLIEFPEWCLFTTPDYKFDLILMRSKQIKEGSEIIGSVWNEVVTKTDPKTYQVVYAVCVGEQSSEAEDDIPDSFNGARILFISSSRSLFIKLKEHD